MEHYVLEVKVATGATKYLVLEQTEVGLVIYDKWDDEDDALGMAGYLDRNGL